MPRDSKYDILFEPVSIGPKVMKNRFYQTPHCTGFGAERPGAQAYLRGMKAEGGWAVVNTEGVCTTEEDDFSGFTTQTRIWNDQDIHNLRLMCDRAHEHGALAGIELLTFGAGSSGFDTRVASRHVTDTVSDSMWFGACYAMDKQDIREIQQAYVTAAIRARTAGFDIINIAGPEAASLPVMFLMRRYNTRTDEYGGTLENRSRFWLETLERVRTAVADDCAIAARFCVDTLHGTDEGIRVEDDGIGFIELADHLVDFWDLQVGGETLANWVKDAGASRFYSEGFQNMWLKKVRPHTKKPIVGVGRFTSPDTMVDVIKRGVIDIIGAARPSIADPFLPRKIEEGKPEEIRECIGCNVCVSRVNAHWHVVCTQNATMGEEYRRGWHPERFDEATNKDRDVLIVGAGPAGMECAIVLGKRGFRRVHLVDANPEPGGHFSWVPRLPGLSAWERVISWRRGELQRLPNVEVVTSAHLSAAEVRDYGADIVIIATGARWVLDGLNGPTQRPIPGADAALSHVLTPEQIMVEGKRIPGRSVLVYDTEAYFMGVSLAEKIARDGYDVIYVTPMTVPGMYMTFTGEAVDMLPMLHGLGVRMITGHMVMGIEPGRIIGRMAIAPDDVIEWPAEAVVLTTQRRSDAALYHALRADTNRLQESGVQAVYRIGDCLAPRQQVADAIFDGHRLGREIDSGDPRAPLPYIREERFIGATDEDYDEVLADRSGVFRPASADGTTWNSVQP